MPALQSRGRGRGRRLVNEINVVPYIDVMLVLLVIFMVTAPLLPPAAIDLPSAGRGQQKAEPYIEARLGKDGRIALITMNAGESQRAEAGTRDFIAQARRLGAGAAGAGLPVVVAADKERPYGEVVGLLDALQRANIRAALMVKPGP
ncbi:MAG: biopolymer transporter ExbD [Burkholderiales bacterium]|jgi:biopolymer transport protein TolR